MAVQPSLHPAVGPYHVEGAVALVPSPRAGTPRSSGAPSGSTTTTLASSGAFGFTPAHSHASAMSDLPPSRSIPTSVPNGRSNRGRGRSPRLSRARHTVPGRRSRTEVPARVLTDCERVQLFSEREALVIHRRCPQGASVSRETARRSGFLPVDDGARSGQPHVDWAPRRRSYDWVYAPPARSVVARRCTSLTEPELVSQRLPTEGHWGHHATGRRRPENSVGIQIGGSRNR